MATQTNLEQNVKKQAKALDPAQKEFVLAELKTYMWNKQKIEAIQKAVDSGELDVSAQKAQLTIRHQLVAENSTLFGHIMKWLKGTATEKSELDDFLGE
jgi:hypothetical protein